VELRIGSQHFRPRIVTETGSGPVSSTRSVGMNLARPFKGSDILDSARASVELRCDRCNGFATLMRGKSRTRRDVAH
jgi:hypothetical protein